MKLLLILTALVPLFINSQDDYVYSILEKKIDHVNEKNNDFIKTGLWIEEKEKVESFIIGNYNEGLKNGIWLEIKDTKLTTVSFYKNDTSFLNLGFFNDLSITFDYTDSNYVENKFVLYGDKEFPNFSDSLADVQENLYDFYFIENLKDGISMYILGLRDLNFSISNGKNNYIHIVVSTNENGEFTISQIFETNNNLYNNEYYFFNITSYKVNAMINFKNGLLDGTSVIYDKSNTPKYLYFNNGQLTERKNLSEIPFLNYYFTESKKHLYFICGHIPYNVKTGTSPNDINRNNFNHLLDGCYGSSGSRNDYLKAVGQKRK